MARIEHVEGLRELERALKQLPRATGKGIVRNVLKKRGKPIADTAEGLAPRDEGDLAASIGVSTKLSKRQAKLARKEGKDDVEVYVGAGPLPQAHLTEFGSVHNAPTPFMRPAWDQHKNDVLKGIGDDLWASIKKAADRLARRRG